jgi:hypothetical protein
MSTEILVAADNEVTTIVVVTDIEITLPMNG